MPEGHREADRELGAHYVLGLKGNQGTLHGDVKLYFGDPGLLAGCAYHKAVDKAHGAVEIREYWQAGDVAWLCQRKGWKGLSSIVMTRNTTVRGEAMIKAGGCRYTVGVR